MKKINRADLETEIEDMVNDWDLGTLLQCAIDCVTSETINSTHVVFYDGKPSHYPYIALGDVYTCDDDEEIFEIES